MLSMCLERRSIDFDAHVKGPTLTRIHHRSCLINGFFITVVVYQLINLAPHSSSCCTFVFLLNPPHLISLRIIIIARLNHHRLHLVLSSSIDGYIPVHSPPLQYIAKVTPGSLSTTIVGFFFDRNNIRRRSFHVFNCLNRLSGTRKTYTLGKLDKDDASESGIMVRALEDVIYGASLASDSIEISYLQIYIESVQDSLLVGKVNIPIVEDPKNGKVLVPGATVINIQNVDHFLHVLQIGEANRHAANTKMNT